jgi:cation diffusion facilitator family transporter
VIVIEGSANLSILALKLAVGIAVSSMAILADAIHSLTDVANNLVAWIVIRLAARPADPGHPYGHRKFETVAVFGLAMLLTVMAFELAMYALRREPSGVAHSGWALWGMLLVLAANTVLATWQGAWARRLESDILRADAHHTFADVLTTIVVIAGWQAAARGYVWIDTLAALAVAALILFLAFGLFRRSIPILVDQAAIEPLQLSKAALGVGGVVAVRSARSRSYGSRFAIDLTIEVEPDLSTSRSHEIASEVEHAVRARFPVESVSVHIEPAKPS